MFRLPYEFYNRNTVEVARDLLGKRLVVGNLSSIIIETEAYTGYDDEASHAFKGITKRSKIMFGRAGHVYVYMIYGMYYCLNIVAENEGQAGAVLIRGIKLPNEENLIGPGKVCRHLGITIEHNGIDLLNHEEWSLHSGFDNFQYIATPRIGITKAADKLWRFIAKPSLSIRA